MNAHSVLGIHLICHKNQLVSELPDGHFETHAWALDRRNLKPGQVYVALHERRNLQSYRQGILTGWKPDLHDPGRVSLTVSASSQSLPWIGDATGEKGLARAAAPLSRRNLSLVTGPRAYLARVCWNSQGWRCATGEARALESPSSFVAKIGFGHEEWLFNQLLTIDGWRYGFLEPVHSHRAHHEGEIIDVGLYAIDPDKRRCWVGRIHRAEILTEEEARVATAAFEKRGLLEQMRTEVTALKGSTATLKPDVEGFTLFNIRFRPEHLEVADPPEPLPRTHRVWDLNRYNLNSADSADFGGAPSAGTRKLRPEEFDPRNPVGPTPITALHNKIQNRLFGLLQKRYGEDAVVLEKAHVDIVVEHPDLYAFIEVKSDPEARLALRNAIGQLLEYAWYEQLAGQRRPELIVAAPAPLTPAARSYLARLREKEGLKIHYVQITLETAALPAWTAGGFSDSNGAPGRKL